MKDLYREETNHDVYADYCCEKPAGSYADEYVRWLEEKLSKLSQHDVILSLPSLDKIIKKRVKDKFLDGYHNCEKTELLDALDTIKRLVPPSYFEGNGI